MSVCSSNTRMVFIGQRGRHQNGSKKAEHGFHVEEIGETWANRTKSSLVNTGKIFESRTSAGATEKTSRAGGKLHAKSVAWSNDMEGFQETN